ncbi:peptidase, S41 family [Verrucomicrobiia bacterium DG1235]|nr:peptidase, S41 family [Verrucomicrobiae bacterium DG1235]
MLPLAGATVSGATAFEALRGETFEAAWDRVRETYYDSSFGGLDWDEVGDAYRARLAKASDMEAVRKVISDMLYELGESHLSLLSSDFDSQELTSPWAGGWAGVDLCFDGGRIVFYRVDPGGAAYAAGIRDGDTLLSINGKSIRQLKRSLRKTGLPGHVLKYTMLSSALSRFRATVGERVEVEVRSPRSSGKYLREVTLDRFEGRETEPFGNIGQLPLEIETRVLEDGIGYLRFNLWFPAVMPEIRQFVAELPSDAPGLVIDLRGNPGGMMVMAGGLTGLIVEEQVVLGTTTLREGHMNVVGFPQRNAYHGKVALLVDETSVSTSEVFAIGLQELGRARVFGQPTPGAALPSVITSLPNGDALQIALGDFKTPEGISLEGRGVTPDVIVPISPIDLSRGIDTVLVAARNWIQQPN